MKNSVFARTLLSLAVLTLVAATALAQDNSTITINGGRTTVIMKAPSQVHNQKIVPPVHPFYDNIGTSGYNEGTGYTISDGSPIGTEYTPGTQFVSTKAGTTKKVSVAVGFVTGTNAATVYLDKDCKGIPCGKIYKTNLCKKTVHKLYTFGQSSTQTESFKCAVPLKKGKPYWVYVASANNSWLAWNLALSATCSTIEGTNGVWGAPSSGNSCGAMTIK